MRAGFHIVGLQVVDIDALVVEHAIETVNRKLLIDAIDGSFDIVLALIEIILINGTDGRLVEVGAAAEQQACSQYIIKKSLFHNANLL